MNTVSQWNGGWSWALIGVLAISGLSACSGRQAGQPAPAPVAEAAIPADSPLAQVRVGMGMKQVTDLIGEPNDTKSGITGKAFIPFYFGEDRAQTVAYYKGLGRVVYAIANGTPQVNRVEYDPDESGYMR